MFGGLSFGQGTFGQGPSQGSAPIAVAFQAAYRLWLRVVGGARTIQPAAGRRTVSASVLVTTVGQGGQRDLSSASVVRTLGPATL